MRAVLCLVALLAIVGVRAKPLDEVAIDRQYNGAGGDYAVSQFAVADTDTYDDDDDDEDTSVGVDSGEQQPGSYDDGGYYGAQGGQQAKRSVPDGPAAEADESRSSKIALSDLVGAVEHSLVHSAQHLGLGNLNVTLADESGETPETSTVIALPIALPTAADEQETSTASADVLSVVAVSTTSTTTTTTSTTVAPDTGLIGITDDAANNVTILHTIHSTEVHANEQDSSLVDRVQHQHITLFSAGAGVLPLIPAVNADDFVAAVNRSSAEENSSDEERTTTAENDCASAESSHSDESKSSEENGRRKCARTTTNASITTVSGSSSTKTTTTTTTTAKPTAQEILQEKIAEVEAEPVILTQGI